MQNTRKLLSEILASIALILLIVYIVDVGVSMANNDDGFIPLSKMERGIILGGGSIILFLVSFGIGINVSSKILTALLITGGAIMGTTVLVSSLVMPMGDHMESSNQAQSTSFQSIGIIVIGYLIMGLGILRIIRKK